MISPAERERLAASGVRIFSPEDGQQLGLAPMINTIIAEWIDLQQRSATRSSTPS